jgi:ribonucleoside-triphosphate reductase
LGTRYYENRKYWEYVEIATEAFKIKFQSIKERMKSTLLPFLSQSSIGESYFRVENSISQIGFVGLSEAVETLTGAEIYEEKSAVDMALKLIRHMSNYVGELSKKTGLRMQITGANTLDSAYRLARLDIEKYGWSSTSAKRTGSQPYYSTLMSVPTKIDLTLEERLRIDGVFHSLCLGGHLAVIEVKNHQTNELIKITEDIIERHKVGLFAYTKNYTYCFKCNRRVKGHPSKCPNCNSTEAIIRYNRASNGELISLKR